MHVALLDLDQRADISGTFAFADVIVDWRHASLLAYKVRLPAGSPPPEEAPR